MTHTVAYLDGGTSAIIIQMIGGGIAAVAVTMKVYGRRILRFLHLRSGGAEAVAEPPTDTP